MFNSYKVKELVTMMQNWASGVMVTHRHMTGNTLVFICSSSEYSLPLDKVTYTKGPSLAYTDTPRSSPLFHTLSNGLPDIYSVYPSNSYQCNSHNTCIRWNIYTVLPANWTQSYPFNFWRVSTEEVFLYIN